MFALLAGLAFVLHGFGVEPDEHPALLVWIGVALMCWHVATASPINLGVPRMFVRENPPA